MNVTPIDWAIIAVFFVFFLGLAIYLNSLCRSVADFLVSARKVRMWLGIGAGIAGEIGLVSVVAMCEQGYLRGYSFTMIAVLSMVITIPLFGIFGFGIERFRATKAMSVPQYLEMRYTKNVRILSGMLNSLAGVFQMCIFPIVGAGFLQVLMGFPKETEIGGIVVQTTWIIMAALLVCNVIFTYFGGYITLTVSNFFMMILIMGAVTWLGAHLIGELGVQNLWTRLEEQRGVAAFNSFAEGSYGVIWFTWLMMMTILLQFSYGPYLQKYASMDKPKTASRSYLLGGIFGNGRTFMIMGIGVAALAWLGTTKPPGMDVPDNLWPSMATAYFLAQHTPVILMGFLLACLLFADISTTDQYLLSWSTSIVNDCILPFRKQPPSPERHIGMVRWTIAGLCVLFFVAGIFYSPTMPIWEFLWLCANIIGGTGIAVLFGMYWRRANSYGAYAAILANTIIPVTDQIARRVWLGVNPGVDYPFAPEHVGFGAYTIGMVLLIVISLVTPDEGRFWDLGKAVKQMNREQREQDERERDARREAKVNA